MKVAISDLAGNLNLLDTKISIIIATAGVILGLVATCKSNILKAYYFYEDVCYLKAIFLLLTVAYIVSIIVTFICGIKCIMIRFGKSNSSSLWFFDTEAYGGISERRYIGTIETSYCSTGVETAVYGTEGYIILNELGSTVKMNLNAPFNGRHIKYTQARKMTEIQVEVSRDTMYTADNRYEQHLEFLRCITDNKPFSVDMNEALYDMKLVEEVYKSSGN